jgi:hypothetical protein
MRFPPWLAVVMAEQERVAGAPGAPLAKHGNALVIEHDMPRLTAFAEPDRDRAAVGVEVRDHEPAKLAVAAPGGERGLYETPVFSLPAVALAAGKLMKLDPARLTHAVGLAINDHIPMAQTRVQTLSDWKGLAAAEAARNAVFAALLARGA